MKDQKLDGTATSAMVKTVFFSIVIVVSMFATYGFAVTFIPGFAPEFFGEYRTVVSGVLMVFMLDGAALLWQYLRLNEAKSTKQIEIAEEMSRITIGASIILTVSYLLLTNYGLVSDPMIIAYAGYIGIAVIIAVFGYSFYRVWAFFDADPRATKKKFMVDTLAEFTEQTNQAIREQLELRRPDMVASVVDDLIDQTEAEMKNAMRGHRLGNTGDVESGSKTPQKSKLPPAPASLGTPGGSDSYICFFDGSHWKRSGGFRPYADALEAIPAFAESDPDMLWAIADLDGNIKYQIEPSPSPNGNGLG